MIGKLSQEELEEIINGCVFYKKRLKEEVKELSKKGSVLPTIDFEFFGVFKSSIELHFCLYYN